MRLLRPFTGTGAIFFPIGLPPRGTCENATRQCLQSCYVTDPSDFDEETRISELEKRHIYEAVLTLPVKEVVSTFLCDLNGLQTLILHWFGSGDCLSKDLERISQIIESIPPYITQMGFTRNKNLWKKYKHIFALSIEDKSEATDPQAMYSIPDYEKETSVMYVPAYEVRGGFCGPHLCHDRNRDRANLTHYINCRICHRLKIGCFDRRK